MADRIRSTNVSGFDVLLSLLLEHEFAGSDG
jgi:hypothetical protein